MAEGHTVIRWMRRLEPLIGQPIVKMTLPTRLKNREKEFFGRSLVRTETRGKHMLLHFDSGAILHCHAMMFGSWQVGRPGMKLRKPPERIRLRISTPKCDAVFFNGPIIELLTPEELTTHSKISALGPDIMSGDFDTKEVLKRFRKKQKREIGDAIMDQTVVAGIGNVFKSEGLFLARIDPRRPAGEVHPREAACLWEVLIPIMWDNVSRPAAIVTLPEELCDGFVRNWTYRRAGRACFKCRTPIEMFRQGSFKRSTYFCPKCQK